jgi:hypothetical protein
MGYWTPLTISNKSLNINLTGASFVFIYADPTVINKYNLGIILPAC